MYKLYRAKRNARLHHQIRIGGVIHNHCLVSFDQTVFRVWASERCHHAERPRVGLYSL